MDLHRRHGRLLTTEKAMDTPFQVCGNFGIFTLIEGIYVCIDSKKDQQEIVPPAARRSCFVVSPLTAEQTLATVLAPDAPSTIQ